ncbi:hypothetical protein [Thermococcus camini]|uniref:S-layer protein C-terminal domain-containing protein n=1 Tax=Thermococcus camini TaxID=2016373 RepID=A0A7G2DD03_9EURY|nr:hypothetical protein [Thermococcus camini]CAD5245041.1 conserved exported protein of unknown function [Thermococcus camini]
MGTNKTAALFTTLLLLVLALPVASPTVIVTAPQPPIVIVGNPPEGSVVAPYTEYTIYFLVADDYGVTTGPGKIEAYYRINDGEWKEAYLRTTAENPVVASLRARFYGESQNFYVFYRRFTIPGLPAGSRVEFKIKVTDVENHVSFSPVYTYYVVNPEGPRVLIVDPSVEALAFERSFDWVTAQVNASRAFYHYNLSDFEAVLRSLNRGAGQFLVEHHWEFLARDYNISIVSPDELPEALEKFQPQVVVLSNLWVPDWGLDSEEMNALEDYLRSTHAGLIVTAGTLLDSTNPQHIGSPGNVSVASMLRMEHLQLAMAIKDALNMSDVPVMTMNVNTGYPLVFMKQGPFDGGQVSLNVSTVVGWQCLLSETQLGIAKRSLAKFANENGLRLRQAEGAVEGLTGQKFNFSAAVSLLLPEVLTGVSVSDSGVAFEHNGTVMELSFERKFLERMRLLHAVGGRYPVLLARTSDYSGAILASDGDYRATYVSFELEAGGKDEFNVLKGLINWSISYAEPEKPEVILLANDIDWSIKGRLLASQLEALGFSVKRVTADEFDSHKGAEVVVILGGPDAYGGVGAYVRQVLSTEEQNAVRTGKAGMFIRTGVWRSGQVVIVLAGDDRWGTGDKITAYMEGVDFDYAEMLTGVAASIS